MIIKKVDLHWYVLYHDFNQRKIRKYDVLKDTAPIIADMIKKQKITNREDFKKALKSELMYTYWSRAEYEILVGDLFLTKDNTDKWLKEASKVDIWSQIEPNLDIMVDYIIDKMQIKFEG